MITAQLPIPPIPCALIQHNCRGLKFNNEPELHTYLYMQLQETK